MVGRSDGDGLANDVRRHFLQDNRAREADVALDRPVHPRPDDGYEPKIAFEFPILRFGRIGFCVDRLRNICRVRDTVCAGEAVYDIHRHRVADAFRVRRSGSNIRQRNVSGLIHPEI